MPPVEAVTKGDELAIGEALETTAVEAFIMGDELNT